MEIYKITNLVNDKVYIGQSARGVTQRFNRHINDAMTNRLDTHFARAIRKYGPDNFVVEVIDTADTQDELNHKEQYWIREYDSIRHGYNETDAMCKCGGNTYMSKTKREMRSISNKIRKSKLGSLNPHSSKVKCLSDISGEELFFDTVKDCQEYFGMDNHQFISSRLNDRRKSLFLSEWNFAYQDEEYTERPERVNKRGTRVLVTDLDTGKRIIYDSVHMTSREMGIPRHIIDKALRKNDDRYCTIDNYKFDILG